jgi:4-carboxymuconolactone decarboxylase
MKVINANQIPKDAVSSPLFSGPVTRQTMLTKETSKSFNMGIVNFGKGARNKFHSHTSDQMLIVTAGTGIVATEKEERTVSVGDTILIPAGEKHWHGATKDSDFSHITITAVGGATTQLEN